MRLKKEYAITQDTLVILPQFNEEGYLHTLLCNREQTAVLDLSPYQLIDKNLNYLGSSMHSATLNARTLLGHSQKYPVILSKELDIILFPCVSPAREDCIWFSMRHIGRSSSLDRHHTLVEFNNGMKITINISQNAFKAALKKAYELRYKMQERHREFDELINETGGVYCLTKEREGPWTNYEVENVSRGRLPETAAGGPEEEEQLPSRSRRSYNIQPKNKNQSEHN